MQMSEEMSAKVGNDALRNPCGQIAMAHRAEPLQDDEPKKDKDHVRHFGLVALHGRDVPQGAGQPQQVRLMAATPMTSNPASTMRDR